MRSQDRRQQILDCALRVFADKGYHGAAVSDVIQAAGVARGTFYLYFPGKREVFDAVLDGILLRLHEQIRPIVLPPSRDDRAVLEQVRGNAVRVVRLLMTDRDVVRLLVNEASGLDSPVRARLQEFQGALGAWVASSLDDGVAFGIVRAGDTRVMAFGLLGLLQGILRGWASGLLDVAEDRVVDEVLAFLRQGILTLDAPA